MNKRFISHTTTQDWFLPAGMAAVVVTVMLVYWPVLAAGFVWDDWLDFTQRAWLYHGDEWKEYIFSGFNNWKYYFRPLGIAAFVLQARLFDGNPVPMHAVSLVLQLANVTLVMLIARKLSAWRKSPVSYSILFGGLFFGLHPMLVETVTWIGCQFDQLQILFAALGLLASLGLRHVWARAVVTTLCFLLSAASKESAAAFPAIVVLFDLLARSDANDRLDLRVWKLAKANWPVYLLLLLAGIIYLIIRKHAIGTVAGDLSWSLLIPGIAKADEIAWVYLKYWTIMSGIPVELNPLHPVGQITFGHDFAALLGRIACSIGLLILGIIALAKRHSFTGVAILATTIYLLPVLGFLPGYFDESLYHERYSIGAIAMIGMLAPGILTEWVKIYKQFTVIFSLMKIIAIGWLLIAIINVRITIPLWSDDLALWRWAESANPQSSLAASNLIGALVDDGLNAEARAMIHSVLDRNLDCISCYINGFQFAVQQGDKALAETLLLKIGRGEQFEHDQRLTHMYWRTLGLMELREGKPEKAIRALRMAIDIEASEPFTRLFLAEALFAIGDSDEASEQSDWATRLAYPPDRERTRAVGNRILSGERFYSKPMSASETKN